MMLPAWRLPCLLKSRMVFIALLLSKSISSEKDSLGNRYSISLNKPKGSFEKQVIERVYKLVLHGIIVEKKSISCSELDLIKLQKGIFMNYHNYDKFKSQLEMVLSTNTTMSYHLVVQ